MKHLFIRKDIGLTSVCLVKCLLPVYSPRRPIDKCFREASAFSDFSLNTKMITSEGTFRRNLCRMVVYNILQSKVEIDFFLTFILFSMVTIGKQFCTTQNSYSLNKRKFFMKTFDSIKNQFEYCIREWIRATVI